MVLEKDRSSSSMCVFLSLKQLPYSCIICSLRKTSLSRNTQKVHRSQFFKLHSSRLHGTAVVTVMPQFSWMKPFTYCILLWKSPLVKCMFSTVCSQELIHGIETSCLLSIHSWVHAPTFMLLGAPSGYVSCRV